MTSTENSGGEPSAQGTGFKDIIKHGLMFLCVFVALNSATQMLSYTTPTKPTTQSIVEVNNPRPNHLYPLAYLGDELSIEVSVVPPIFNKVNVNIPFAFDFDPVIINTKVDVKSCFETNCTANVLIKWSLRSYSFNQTVPLISHRACPKVTKHRLLSSAPEEDEQKETEYKQFMLPTLTLNPVVDFTVPLPPPFYAFTPTLEAEGKYGPGLYPNTFWILRDRFLEVNSSSSQTETYLVVEVKPLPTWKIAMYEQFETSMKSQQTMGLTTHDSLDETKRIFLETNPYFLGLTALVTVLHMLFEYLAFANDVRFWKGRKDFKGLSLRSVAVNCYFQTIIFLYLIDGSETSMTILLPSGIGVLMEYWKLLQCATISRVPKDQVNANPDADDKQTKQFVILGFQIRFNDSYDKRTRSHDNTAFQWLLYCMIPILIIYTVYSAVYNEHRGWYSFLIHTQVQFIYFFGFVMMTPQIFINYKLKSVGQLPWRTFVYKALNTVIDDLFAFVIKMPWLHRLACFRDDVVFAILLYQRWIYPVDNTRMADGGDDEVDGDDPRELPDTKKEEAASLIQKKTQ